MSTGKKLAALAVLIIAGFGLIYAIEQVNLGKAERETAGPELVDGLLKEPVQKDGMTYFVPPERLFEYGVDVPELHDPKYVSVSSADEILADGIEGIDIEVDGQHYFYSYQILNWHQIVYASFPDADLRVSTLHDLMITFDPLTFSDRVYVGNELVHANLVYDNNTVLIDPAGQLWSQQRGIMLAGDGKGASLTTYPSRSITWETWKDLYPNGQALSTDTGYVRDYTRHPFGAYDENEFIYFPLSTVDTRIADKWVTDGLADDGDAVGFVRDIIFGIGVDNTTIGDMPIVAMYDRELEMTRVYTRDVSPSETEPIQTLTFTYDFDDEEWRDEQTNSVWNANGVAIDGELEGYRLLEIATTQQFWFSWAAQHPNTRLGNQDRITTTETEPEGIDIDVRDLQ